jgi:hypothetical protein
MNDFQGTYQFRKTRSLCRANIDCTFRIYRENMATWNRVLTATAYRDTNCVVFYNGADILYWYTGGKQRWHSPTKSVTHIHNTCNNMAHSAEVVKYLTLDLTNHMSELIMFFLISDIVVTQLLWLSSFGWIRIRAGLWSRQLEEGIALCDQCCSRNWFATQCDVSIILF